MHKPKIAPKSTSPLPAARAAKIARIKRHLGDMQQYKQLLASEGLEPDQDDKVRESELIVQLIRLEKGLAPKAKPKKNRRRSN